MLSVWLFIHSALLAGTSTACLLFTIASVLSMCRAAGTDDREVWEKNFKVAYVSLCGVFVMGLVHLVLYYVVIVNDLLKILESFGG